MCTLRTAMTTLTVVRHGRTAYNVDTRYLGALDPPLDDTGMAQAHTLAASLPRGATVLLCSPRLRARQTAAVLGAAWDLPCRVADAFAERDVGVYEGLTQAEARAAWPVLWNQDITRRWDAAPPGGETIAAVFTRVADGLDRVRRDHPGEQVVLVAHGFVAKVVRALLLPMDRDAFFAYALKNGEYARYALTAQSVIDPCPPALAGARPTRAR
jgi:broad specificity phosphatase PhoE